MTTTSRRINFAELVNINELNMLMASFSEVIDIANAVIDVDGVIITQSGWQQACTQYHRVNPKTCERCIQSDTSLVQGLTQGVPFAIYRCLNGLVDTASPIIVDGQHVANVFNGQFFTDAPDLEFFREQAQQFHFDETEYLAAICKVPVISMERVEGITRFYANIARMLASHGLNRLKQQETEHQLKRLNEELQQRVEERTRELSEKNQLLQVVLDAIPASVFWKDRDSRYLGCNREFARGAGKDSPDAMTGLSDDELPWADLAEHYRADDQAVMQSGQPKLHFEETLQLVDGSVIHLSTSKVPLRDAEGNVFAVLGAFSDITERKRAESALRIAATAFESQEGMLVTDANGAILRTNRAFTKITGYSTEEVLGKNPRLLKSGRQDADFYVAMWESINNTGSWAGEIWNRRKNGEIYPEHLTITAVKDQNGTLTNYVAAFTDVTMRKAAEEKIQHLAFYDPLTRLPNRRLLLDRLKQALASSARSGREGALLLIDLDNFKTINETLGHYFGDLLLQQVAQRLESCIREGDTIARLGGDEFVVMLEDLSEQGIEAAAQAETIGEKILATLALPYRLAAHEYHSTPSVGATLFNGHQSTMDELLKQADIAMYQAKAAGRNTLRFFDPQMQANINVRAVLENDLRRALAENQFRLYFQLQANHHHQITGAEVLIRWQHPERGLASPLDFIPLAEETGLILPIGQWVLETACAQLKAWEGNTRTEHLQLAVNVSARQFHQTDFVEQVCQTLRSHAINPGLLKLELTESIVLDDVNDTIAKMHALKVIGVHFSMDDFGTGYSSLSYLTQLPLDQIKIDQSFVRNIGVKPSDAAIVQTIIGMAGNLGIDVIAEGVETEAQRVFLEQHGCPAFQGYLFSKPVPVEQFEALLKPM